VPPRRRPPARRDSRCRGAGGDRRSPARFARSLHGHYGHQRRRPFVPVGSPLGVDFDLSLEKRTDPGLAHRRHRRQPESQRIDPLHRPARRIPLPRGRRERLQCLPTGILGYWDTRCCGNPPGCAPFPPTGVSMTRRHSPLILSQASRRAPSSCREWSSRPSRDGGHRPYTGQIPSNMNKSHKEV
jgi:hypothetical protein